MALEVSPVGLEELPDQPTDTGGAAKDGAPRSIVTSWPSRPPQNPARRSGSGELKVRAINSHTMTAILQLSSIPWRWLTTRRMRRAHARVARRIRAKRSRSSRQTTSGPGVGRTRWIGLSSGPRSGTFWAMSPGCHCLILDDPRSTRQIASHEIESCHRRESTIMCGWVHFPLCRPTSSRTPRS